MKKLLLPIFSLLFVVLNYSVHAQLSGTYGIPADFPTIEKAIDSLNQVGVGGNVTFNVAAGHTETFSKLTAGLITATGYPDSQIIFTKWGGGANPKITAPAGGVSLFRDGIIIIAGGDYIVFNAIDVQENPLNTNKQNMMEWGYALVKASKDPPINGCRYVQISNCNITLNKADSLASGIYAGNHRADTTTTLTLNDSLDVMSYCKFFGNTISNVNFGFRISGSTAAGFLDRNNEIGVDGGNNISDFYGTGSNYGINAEYQSNLKVANNVINGGGLSQTGVIYGIRTGAGTNANVDIYNNTVTLVQGGTSLIYAITNSTGGSGTNNFVNIYNNTIENCLYSSSSGNSVWLIYNLASCHELNIYGNIIRNNTKSLGTGPMHCIYNSPTSADTNVYIYNNEIYNNFCAGPLNGINIDLGVNVQVYKNKIYNLTTNSTSSAVSGVYVQSGPINTYIYNNFISDLKAPVSSSDNTIRGINITSTTSNSNIGLYYNTIFLNSTGNGGSSGIFHTNSTTATTAALDMRNNIVVNKSSPGLGKTVAFRRSAVNVNLNNYSTLSNNNLLYAGTPGVNNLIFYDGTNSDQTMTAFKQRVSPREVCSVTENAPFSNTALPPYNLHIQPVSTQIEAGGISIATPITITDDIDGDPRNATTPDMGADEFSGTPLDLTPPSINYTLFVDTISTSNRYLLGVTIEDCFSGVNVTSGAAPRIYYKKYSDANTYVDNTSSTNGWKYTESVSGSSPFNFTIDYSLLFGGNAQSGDTIQYFVVAQDVASTPNVGIRQGTFAATPSSVSLTSAAFPISGSINFYKIQRLISGTVKVGTGGDYLTLTGEKGLFVSINENFLSGNTTAKIISDITEPGTYALNQWNEASKVNYTLTIQPDTSVLRKLSGSYAGGLIRFNGADKVTVDGRFNGSGNYLAFENSSTSASTAVFQLSSLGAGSGVTDITIRNSNIKGGSNTVTSAFGIFVGGTSISTSGSGADNNNVTISDNAISNCRYGIYARGTSSNLMNGLVISGNNIGPSDTADYVTEYGINVQAAAAPQITKNEVHDMTFDVSRYGIWFGTYVTDAVVSQNKVHSFDQPGTSGFNAVGIMFSSGTGCSGNQIINNMIYNLKIYGSTSMYLVGIRIVGGSNYKVYYNTVYLTGTYGSGTASVVSACLHIPTTAAANIDVRDNIFSNTMSGNNPKNYLIHSLNTTTFTQLDYNDYWNTGSVFGFWGADVANFTNWKTTVGKDVNSKNVAVTFVSTTDAHLSGSSIGDYNLRGTPLAGVTADFDGDTRSTIFPYMGADERPEALLYCSLNLTALIEGFYDGSNMVTDTITVELHNASSPYALVDQAKVVLNSSGNANANFFTAVDATNYYLAVKHRNSIETWSSSTPSFSGGTLSYNFTTSQSQAYNNNLKLKSGKYCIFGGEIANNDQYIDGDDVTAAYNAQGNSGYVIQDVTGDNYVDGDDVTLTHNNQGVGVTNPIVGLTVKETKKQFQTRIESEKQ